VRDPEPVDGDGAEDRLEGERPSAAELDAGAALTPAPRQDQLPIGVLDQGCEQGPLRLQSGPMDMGLDGVGDC
jgi:hypothetical protein